MLGDDSIASALVERNARGFAFLDHLDAHRRAAGLTGTLLGMRDEPGAEAAAVQVDVDGEEPEVGVGRRDGDVDAAGDAAIELGDGDLGQGVADADTLGASASREDVRFGFAIRGVHEIDEHIDVGGRRGAEGQAVAVNDGAIRRCQGTSPPAPLHVVERGGLVITARRACCGRCGTGDSRRPAAT